MEPTGNSPSAEPTPPDTQAYRNIPVDQLKPNPWNRTVFDPDAMNELVTNVQVNGILERLIVRPLPDGGYEIASGHRRWLVAQKLGIKEIPCEIRPLTDEQVQDIDLIVNLLKEDLPVLEQARMIKARVGTDWGSRQAMARKLSKSPSLVSELLGFMDLPPDALEIFSALKISFRALQAVKRLGQKDLQMQVAQELKEGKIQAQGMEKRCGELGGVKKSAQVTRKGQNQPNSAVPDPLSDIWSAVQTDLSLAADVYWDVKYGAHKLGPGDEARNAWNVLVMPLDNEGSDPKPKLAGLFGQLTQKLGNGKVAEYVPEAARQVQGTNQDAINAMGLKSVPQTPQEEKDLEAVAVKEGPKGVYRRLCGEDSAMTKMAPNTWAEVGMTSAEGLRQILDGIRQMQQASGAMPAPVQTPLAAAPAQKAAEIPPKTSEPAAGQSEIKARDPKLAAMIARQLAKGKLR